MQIKYDCILKDDKVRVQGPRASDWVDISFQRTIRVPDSNKVSQLPPGLGRFPLFLTSDHADKLPVEMVAKGGAFLPIYQREALWVKFTANEPFAVKVYVGGVNATSGEPLNENEQTKIRRKNRKIKGHSIQDYVILPEQQWLDGIATSNGLVRQFVAMPYGQAYSVEKQLTGEEVNGGMQIEVTPAIRIDGHIPRINGLLRPGSMPVFVKTLTGRTITVLTDPDESVAIFKYRIEDRESIPIFQQRLDFQGKRLDNDCTLHMYSIKHHSTLHLTLRLRGGGGGCERKMAVAAGGKIEQVILPDNSHPQDWRAHSTVAFNIQLLNALSFRDVVGRDPPSTPVSAETYKEFGFPFFTMYEEPSDIHGEFSGIQSVAQLEGQEEPHHDFPVKAIESNSGIGSVKGERANSLINPKGPFTLFRHVTQLEALVRKLNINKDGSVNSKV